ncbi:acyl-CoA thioesterase [Sphingobium subterraneum]|uniref:Acyl-CoA thioesterase-2 n=1 Tax=Sphingobium subterraneum TaxID=627688 RepID=A0A841IUT0_9SPHN|nr:acyl-CoA thioesterase domain-containing protein [Sphingobium subterraneum]MBB6122433.1 acyl-CoA thioesterase-2 [Sphingobium subterraneum]
MTSEYGDSQPVQDDRTDREKVDSLLTLLDVRHVDKMRFVGARKIGGIGRVFGGQVIAQALMAAAKTVAEDRSVHSLHAYFLRPGSEDHEIEYRVEADFDGRSFSNRRVVAIQQDRPIFNLAASFHRMERGPEHWHAIPDVKPPELGAPLDTMKIAGDPEATHMARVAARVLAAFDIRPVRLPGGNLTEQLGFWFRTRASLDCSQAMHRVIVSFVTDISLLSSASMRHRDVPMQHASIDHALWFHEDMRADEWMLYTTESPRAGGGRGLGRGMIFNREGRLIVSSAQEGMMRIVERKE